MALVILIKFITTDEMIMVSILLVHFSYFVVIIFKIKIFVLVLLIQKL